MSVASIHQLVHGYSKGHSFLAGSCRLSKKALDIVTEQSDLSGPLPAGALIPSYLTAYAVSDSEYFALARTWPDTNAPRSGCVITHTLMIPKDLWATTESPQSFLHLLRQPDRSSLDQFTSSLKCPEPTGDDHERPLATSAESQQFVSKIFSEGLRTVVWFECQDPDSLVIACVRLLWPALRLQLYANTFSLQSHARVDSELQLHFAPRSAQSHFSRIPKECLITKGGAKVTSDVSHEWIGELADYLKAGNPGQEYLRDVNQYGHLLGTDPTAIRSLFVLRELTGRLSHTPMAAVGIMDIIESLEPTGDRGLPEKQRALDAAIEAATRAETETALHCLSFVDTRLRRPSFSKVGCESRDSLRTSVAQLVSKKPQALFSTCGQGAPLEDSSFWQGVRGGLASVAAEQPLLLSGLGRYPEVASFVVRAAPDVAASYLRATSDDRESSVLQVVEWIRRIEDVEQRRHLRRQLLNDANDDAGIPLLEELLRDLREDDVFETLESLVDATQGFTRVSIRRVIVDFVCERFPAQTIRWGIATDSFLAHSVPDVIATAIPQSLEGLEQVLQLDWKSAERRCEIWSAFVDRVAKNHLPHWFTRRAANDPAVIEPFIGVIPLSPRAVRALETIGSQCDYIPIARSDYAEQFLETMNDSPLCELFSGKVVTSAISEHIAGKISDSKLIRLLQFPRVTEWCGAVPAERIHELLVSPSDAAAWQRAWTTLSVLPQAMFQRITSHRLISTFSRSYRANWSSEVALKWSHILERGREEVSHEESIRLLTDALSFSFNNTSLPIGVVVFTAFPPVYDAVAANKASQITDDMFGYFDWDKAKRLRKDVIEAYIASDWPAEDLAMIAAKCQILRKVFNRLRRKWGGDQYLSRMSEGLKRRNSPEALSVWQDLSSMMHDPDFFEPWD